MLSGFLDILEGHTESLYLPNVEGNGTTCIKGREFLKGIGY